MITDIASYLRFFDGVRRRTERDIAALPAAAAVWRPPAVGGEAGWSIGQIVGHIDTARLYFASAYRDEGWIGLAPSLDPPGSRAGRCRTSSTVRPNRSRRTFLALGIGALVIPACAWAQQPGKVYSIGLFHVGLDHVPASLSSLRQRLRELGYEEGKNLRLDWRNLPDEDAARAAAESFVRDGVDLIVAFENHTVRAAKGATSKIPIVMLHVTDPVSAGFVESLARPASNITGVAGLADLPAKRLELFKDILPTLRRVLLLVDPQDAATPRQLEEVRRAGRALNLALVERQASNETELRGVFASVRAEEADGVFVVSPNLYLRFARVIIRLALEKRMPAASHRRFWAQEGALFSYGANLASVGSDAAEYVDKILKGARPADLPVQELARFELVVNLKTAKALGLTIPPSVLLRADQVIE